MHLVECCHSYQYCDDHWQTNECGAFSEPLQTWLEVGILLQAKHRLAWLRLAHEEEPVKTGPRLLHLCSQQWNFSTYDVDLGSLLLQVCHIVTQVRAFYRKTQKLQNVWQMNTCKRWYGEAFDQLRSGKRWEVPY